MTRRVFETVKTIVGVRYGKSLYKTSKLETTLKEVVSMYESHEMDDRRKNFVYSPALSSPGLAKRRKRSSLGTLPIFSSLSNAASASSPQLNEWIKAQANEPHSHRGETAVFYDDRAGACKT